MKPMRRLSFVFTDSRLLRTYSLTLTTAAVINVDAPIFRNVMPRPENLSTRVSLTYGVICARKACRLRGQQGIA